MTFYIATVGLQCGTEVCRDRVFSVTTRVAHLVLRHSLWCPNKGLVGGVMTDRTRDRAQHAHDRTSASTIERAARSNKAPVRMIERGVLATGRTVHTTNLEW